MKIRHIPAILASILLAHSVGAQTVTFGVTNTIILGRPAIAVVGGPQGLSADLQVSFDGTNNFLPAVGWAPFTLNGQSAFVKTDGSRFGYYRVAVTSNSVAYYQTNKVSPHFLLQATLVGGNQSVTVLGPTNVAYRIRAGDSLTNLSVVSIGQRGDTNFLYPGLLKRFFHAEVQ